MIVIYEQFVSCTRFQVHSTKLAPTGHDHQMVGFGLDSIAESQLEVIVSIPKYSISRNHTDLFTSREHISTHSRKTLIYFMISNMPVLS